MVAEVDENPVVALFASKARYGYLSEIARAVDASPNAVGEWASGKTYPSDRYWPALEAWFGVRRGFFAKHSGTLAPSPQQKDELRRLRAVVAAHGQALRALVAEVLALPGVEPERRAELEQIRDAL